MAYFANLYNITLFSFQKRTDTLRFHPGDHEPVQLKHIDMTNDKISKNLKNLS